jgi:hypothetical protein
MSKTTNTFININHHKEILGASFTWMRHLHDKLCRHIYSPQVFPLALSEWGDMKVAKNATAITIQTLKPDS